MARHEAVYVVDEEFVSFQELWNGLSAIARALSAHPELSAEPFRYGISGATDVRRLLDAEPKPSSVGWHIRTQASHLAGPLTRLIDLNREFTVRLSPSGNAHSIEIRFRPGSPATLYLPVEDSPCNLPRFFRRYSKALEKIALDPFLEFATQNGGSEPMAVYERKTSLFASPRAVFEFSAVQGKVGRHEILEEIRITSPKAGIERLVQLLHDMGVRDSLQGIPQLYLQYFEPNIAPHSLPDLHFGELHEVTSHFDHLESNELTGIADAIVEMEREGLLLTDLFALIEQRSAQVDGDCAVSYTLRKSRLGGYEIRANIVWNASPAGAIDVSAELLRHSGRSWSQFV